MASLAFLTTAEMVGASTYFQVDTSVILRSPIISRNNYGLSFMLWGTLAGTSPRSIVLSSEKSIVLRPRLLLEFLISLVIFSASIYDGLCGPILSCSQKELL